MKRRSRSTRRRRTTVSVLAAASSQPGRSVRLLGCASALHRALNDPLVAAANGQVTPAGATPDARTIVGRCTNPGGVAAGAVGLMRIA